MRCSPKRATPWLPSSSLAILKLPEIPWTPGNGISPLRNVSAAPIGKQKLKKAPPGLAPPSLPKFRRCLWQPNANRPRIPKKFPPNRRSRPSKPANHARKFPQWNIHRPASPVELQGLAVDVAAAVVKLPQRGAPKAPLTGGNCLPLPFHRFLQQKSKDQAASLIPASKNRSPKLRRLHFVDVRVIPVCPHASLSWK